MKIDDFADTPYSPFNHVGVNVRTIGWLGANVPRTGTVPGEFKELLNHLYRYHNISDGELGYHDCEICNNYVSHGELWLEINGIRYVMPLMILHYIQEHRYCPPKEFIDLCISFWRSEKADPCKAGRCKALPDDSYKGFHGPSGEIFPRH